MKLALLLKKSCSSDIIRQKLATVTLPKKFTVIPQTGQLHVQVEELAKIWHEPTTDNDNQECCHVAF